MCLRTRAKITCEDSHFLGIILYLIWFSAAFPPTRRGKCPKPLQVGRFLPYPSRKTPETSTGRLFFALPVEENARNLYGSAVFCPTRRGKRPKPLQVGCFLPYPSRKTPEIFTGRLFFALPVEENARNLYRSTVFRPTRRGKRPKPLRVGCFLPYLLRKMVETSTGRRENETDLKVRKGR